MIDFNEDHYRDLCRTGRVRLEIDTIEEKRRAAIRRFWLTLLAGFAVTGLLVAALVATQALRYTIFVGLLGLVGSFVLAIWPLGKVGRDLKLPVLDALAGRGGLHYAAEGFDPPVYAEARAALFGKWLSAEHFTDLFQGTDTEGRNFAVYEARLTRRVGKNTQVVFAGQAYAFQRRRRIGGQIVIVPDRGIFNFFKPAGGFERVKFPDDPEFETKFEVYATHPHEALGLIGLEARRKFLRWRAAGRVMAYIGPADAFVAIPGKDRFEAGSMFRAKAGEQRVRAMFDEVRAALATLRSLKGALDQGF